MCSKDKIDYSRVHISSDEVFSKILKKPSIVQKKMIPHMNDKVVFIGNKQFFFVLQKNSKWPTKKAPFPAPSILNIFSQKFHGLVFWLVELIDAKGIGVAQPIWL